MAIKASQVKELREMTGAGMMDCKKALTETDGDWTRQSRWCVRAVWLRHRRRPAVAAEGSMFKSTDDGKKATVVEVNSETGCVPK